MDEQNNKPQEPEKEAQKQQAKHFMVFYVIALFSIALVLILLSYLTQVRADDKIALANSKLQEQVSATQGIQAKMEVLQETNNEQAQRIAELEQTLEKALNENERLGDQASAQGMLLKAAEYAMNELTYPQARSQIDALINEYGLEKLDGSSAEKLVWTAEDAKIFNNIRTKTAENK